MNTNDSLSPESEGIVYYMCLYLAAHNGRKDIVEFISELPTKPACDYLFELASLVLMLQDGDLDMFKCALENTLHRNSNNVNEEIHKELNLDRIDIGENVDNNDTGINAKNIFEAAEIGGPNELKEFFDSNVNDRDENGFSPLHIATHQNRERNVAFLLDHGAEVDYHQVRSKNKTALHVACEDGHLNVVSILLNRGADVDAVDADYNCPLVYAITAGNRALVQLLLEKGAKTDVIDTKTRNSPLHYAVINGNEDIVRLLLGKGANTECKNKELNFPLHYAVINGKVEIVRLLLDNGANVHSQSYLVHAKNADVIRLLLERGLYDKHINTYGRTILLEAVEARNSELVSFLLERQYHFNVNTNNSSGRSLLMIATINNECNIMETLLQHGANVNFTSDEGTSLHLAIEHECYDAAELLLRHNANVDQVRPGGRNETPLMLAIKDELFVMVKLLLSKGASTYIHDSNGWSASRYAEQYGTEDIRELI